MNPTYYLFLIADELITVLPIRVSRALAHFGALLYYYCFPRKRRQIERNMRRALGPDASERLVRTTARRACRYYADYWVDIFWLPTRSREWVIDNFHKVNEPALDRALSSEKKTRDEPVKFRNKRSPTPRKYMHFRNQTKKFT